MSTGKPDNQSPYTFELLPVSGREGVFTWVIRYRGKTFQRSDHVSGSEAKARKEVEEAIERLVHSRVQS
jgi:hypothetical protein